MVFDLVSLGIAATILPLGLVMMIARDLHGRAPEAGVLGLVLTSTAAAVAAFIYWMNTMHTADVTDETVRSLISVPGFLRFWAIPLVAGVLGFPLGVMVGRVCGHRRERTP